MRVSSTRRPRRAGKTIGGSSIGRVEAGSGIEPLYTDLQSVA